MIKPYKLDNINQYRLVGMIDSHFVLVRKELHKYFWINFDKIYDETFFDVLMAYAYNSSKIPKYDDKIKFSIIAKHFEYTLDEYHERSHNCEKYYGEHVLKRHCQDDTLYHIFDILRTSIREIEIEAISHCKFDDEGYIVYAYEEEFFLLLNRLSSMFFVLSLECLKE